MTTANVQNISDGMANIEGLVRRALRQGRGLRDDFKAIAADDDNGITTLLASKHHARLIAILTNTTAELLDLHQQMVDDAADYGVDDMPPVADPDDDDEIGILSGGGR